MAKKKKPEVVDTPVVVDPTEEVVVTTEEEVVVPDTDTNVDQVPEVVEVPTVDEVPEVPSEPTVDEVLEVPTDEVPEVPTEEVLEVPTTQPTEPIEEEVEEQVKLLNVDDVKQLLADASVSSIDTLKTIATKAVPMLKTLAGSILDYEEEFAPKNGIKDGAYVISKNYNLFMVIRNVVETKDKEVFKVKFDILNLAFREFKDSSLNNIKLHAYDYKWTYGDKQLLTFQKLITAISLLCDRSKLSENIKKVDINTIMSDTDLTETTKDNLVGYYNI